MLYYLPDEENKHFGKFNAPNKQNHEINFIPKNAKLFMCLIIWLQSDRFHHLSSGKITCIGSVGHRIDSKIVLWWTTMFFFVFLVPQIFTYDYMCISIFFLFVDITILQTILHVHHFCSCDYVVHWHNYQFTTTADIKELHILLLESKNSNKIQIISASFKYERADKTYCRRYTLLAFLAGMDRNPIHAENGSGG